MKEAFVTTTITLIIRLCDGLLCIDIKLNRLRPRSRDLRCVNSRASAGIWRGRRMLNYNLLLCGWSPHQIRRTR